MTRAAIILLAALAGVFPSAPAVAAGEPLDRIARLVEANTGDELVLRAARLMLPFSMTTADLVALKEAGASDELVLALLNLTEAVAAQSRTEMTFRISSVPDGRGGRAILLTNLDHTGRHLDGRAPRGTPFNIVRSRERPRSDEAWVDSREDDPAASSAPVVVVVNNNPPPPPEPGPPPSAFTYDAFGNRAYLPTHTTSYYPVALGGAVGPVKYPLGRHFLGHEAAPGPKSHYFLGYAPDGTRR